MAAGFAAQISLENRADTATQMPPDYNRRLAPATAPATAELMLVPASPSLVCAAWTGRQSSEGIARLADRRGALFRPDQPSGVDRFDLHASGL